VRDWRAALSVRNDGVLLFLLGGDFDTQKGSRYLASTVVTGGTLVVKADAGGENRKRRSKIFP